MGDASDTTHSVGGGGGEATYAAATLGGDELLAGTLGATSLGIGLVAAYDRRKSESRDGGPANGGLGGISRARRPGELGATFKTGIATIVESGNADSGGSGVREVMAAPILSPSSASTMSPILSGYAAQHVPGSSAAPLLPGSGGTLEQGGLSGIGRGGRGAGVGRGVAPPVPVPASGPPVHSRPPSVASRAHAGTPHQGGPSHVLGSLAAENAGGMTASQIARLPSAGRASGRGSRMSQHTPGPGVAPPLPPGVAGSGFLARHEQDRNDVDDDESVRSEFGGLWKPLGKSEADQLTGSSDRFGTRVTAPAIRAVACCGWVHALCGMQYLVARTGSWGQFAPFA